MGNRYDTPESAETQYEPGSNGEVLRNLAGITSKQVMDQAEYEALVKVQLRYAEEILTEETQVTSGMICEMHREWLGKLYEWAGRYRTVNVAKGDFKWPPSERELHRGCPQRLRLRL